MNWAAIISMRQSPAVKSARVKGRYRLWLAVMKQHLHAKPLFELLGKNITLVGGNGDGQTCKVAKSDYRGAQY